MEYKWHEKVLGGCCEKGSLKILDRIRGSVAVSGDRVGDTLPPAAEQTIAINKL